MNFKEYQDIAMETAIYPPVIVESSTPQPDVGFVYPIMGLTGEVGEMNNKLKKVIRDGIEIDKEDMKAELGDVLWYIAALATELDLDLNEVAEYNAKKLADRMERGVISGSGDSR